MKNITNGVSRRLHPVRDPLEAYDAGIILCCVPYWDSTKFIAAGGRFQEGIGHFTFLEDDHTDLEEWLPRKFQFRGTPPQPVLLPDMLPSSTWENNLRTSFTEDEWDRLRKFCYQAAGNACVACGSRGEPHLECHEAWSFDEATGVQKLKGLLCLCPVHHKAKHLGFANRIGRLNEVLMHLKWLNDWNDDQLQRGLADVEARQRALSSRTWKLDLSFLRTYGVR